jgi:uroporphyrinogen decarboxylase
MPIAKDHRLLRALRRQPVDSTPIWIMRQAGRYLPEYREVRKKTKNFMTLCKTPELACEITLQPLKRFALDAAIIFSDILTIPDAMGLGLYFETNEGPHFLNPVQDIKSVKNLIVPDVEKELSYVMHAIRLARSEIAEKVPLIGFSGSPWTLATYMVEGKSSKHFNIVKRFLFTEPDIFKLLLNKLVTIISLYLKAQVAAGVQVLMIFDTWGGVLTPHDYQHFSLNPIAHVIKNVKTEYPKIPVILFTRNAGQHLQMMAKSGADALGLDWTTDIGFARREVGDSVALQGNMDPAILYTSPSRIREEIKKILASFGQGSGHIFNLGHGIYPDIPPENVRILSEMVHELSKPYHPDP